MQKIYLYQLFYSHLVIFTGLLPFLVAQNVQLIHFPIKVEYQP